MLHAISRDVDYRAPQPKLTVTDRESFMTEMSMFQLLDTLKLTATDLDGIPAWFLSRSIDIRRATMPSLGVPT